MPLLFGKNTSWFFFETNGRHQYLKPPAHQGWSQTQVNQGTWLVDVDRLLEAIPPFLEAWTHQCSGYSHFLDENKFHCDFIESHLADELTITFKAREEPNTIPLNQPINHH